ncbi:MAG TPA: hypothetical protein VGL82_20860 [Bryobacteraceae bacterium]|jgi:hypothetical protein
MLTGDSDLGNSPQLKRISVAALAVDWVSFDGESRRVALVNDGERGLQGARDCIPTASAFGGGVLLEDTELHQLRLLGSVVERQGSRDARMIAEAPRIPAVLDWFRTKGSDRWLVDIVREIREEAFYEGDPVFDVGSFRQLCFEFDRVVELKLNPMEIRSSAAIKLETTYLWWFYRVMCPLQVLQQMESSKRVLFPSKDEIARRRSGLFALSATLAC